MLTVFRYSFLTFALQSEAIVALLICTGIRVALFSRTYLSQGSSNCEGSILGKGDVNERLHVFI